MLQVKTALESTSSHALPRMVSKKPIHVRICWLLIFLVMLCLFIKSFSEFVIKLQSRQVTSTLESNSVKFQLPDVYVCFENPVSGSYSANVDQQSADAINAALNATTLELYQYLARSNFTGDVAVADRDASAVYPSSLPYGLLVDSLAHRREQSVISSQVLSDLGHGTPMFEHLEAEDFYHPLYLRCIKWKLDSTFQTKIQSTGSTSGLVTRLLLDSNHSELVAAGALIHNKVYINHTTVPVSDWSLNINPSEGTDRSAGVQVFLTQPGQYPSDFVTQFSLGPGKHHTVEIDMTRQVYKKGQFDCVSDPPDVQFLNPYDQTSYNHSYSYSYCYYNAYHKEHQAIFNKSGDFSPLPWLLRDKMYLTNITGSSEAQMAFFCYGHASMDPESSWRLDRVQSTATALCQSRRPCSSVDYRVSISSADWPTQSSLAPFVSSSIKQAWTNAKAKNLSVPALDFLLTGNASSVASYVRSNLLKVHFKPHRAMCDRVTFSIDYGPSNFISDVGGIMGIYLGMSLLTLCELLELIYDIFAVRRRTEKSQSSAASPELPC